MTEKNIDPIIELASNNIPEIDFDNDSDDETWVDDFLDDLGLDF